MLLVLIAALIGAASAFAFAPVGLWPLMPLALAALCELIWRSKSLKHSLAVGWGFGLGQFAVGLNWIATAFTFQAAMPAWLGWVAVVLLSLYLAVYPALAAGLAWRFKETRPVALLLTLAGAWPVTEWLRGTIFTGFPWNPVGVALDDTPWLRVAPYLGTYSLSLLVVLIGGAFWLLSKRRWRAGATVAVPLGLMLLLPQPLVPDSRNLTILPNPLPKRLATGTDIRVVQPNIGQEDKWREGFAEQAARRLAVLSMKPGGSRPRLLLWPEAAVTDPLEDARTDEHQALAEFERTRAAALVGRGEYLLTGGLAVFSRDGRFVDGAANSVFILGHGGHVVARYDKAHLVPYGEYLPMRPLLSSIGLSRLAPGDIDFASGPGPRTVALPGWGKVGFQLCYEIIFSGEVVDRRNRPDFIFNPSNDAWFGRWGPPQHLAQARLRAAEEGIPVVRSTPTGISAVIDAHGAIVKALPWQAAGVIDAQLPSPAVAPTMFARFGNIIPLLLGFALIIGGIVLGVTRR
ncbi:MAG TPA: apolipoprotein N-acyltransferase [Sphingomicrobium sp.]